MNIKSNYIINSGFTIRDALKRLNDLGIPSLVLFVEDDYNRLIGSLTDGDIRRGLLKDASVEDSVVSIMNVNCVSVGRNELNKKVIKELRQRRIFYFPVVNEDGTINNIINLNEYREFVPIEAIIMAGGKGERLMPLTRHTPKPLLKIGEKPIMEYAVDRLIDFGITKIYISVNYLGEQIEDYFKDGSKKGIEIRYIREPSALGTIGSVGLVDDFRHEVVLLMNSDLLTNIDFEDFYQDFLNRGADMAVATIPHHVDLPYAILELEEDRVISLQEKPRYTYFANAGIYLIRKNMLTYIPKGEFFNATDLMELAIREQKKVINYPILEYWLDIGKMNDFVKAQEDIRHLML